MPEGHAEGRHRETQRRSCQYAERLGHPQEARRAELREDQTPEYLGKFHKAEIEKWWPIIKAANIKAE